MKPASSNAARSRWADFALLAQQERLLLLFYDEQLRQLRPVLVRHDEEQAGLAGRSPYIINEAYRH